MARILIAFAFMIALTWFVRHQFDLVMRKITAPQPTPQPLVRRPSDGPHKCLFCGGTGRREIFYYPRTGGPPVRTRTEPCPMCNGTGWMGDPSFGR